MSFFDAGSAGGCASSALLGGGCEGMGMDFQSFNLRLAYRFLHYVREFFPILEICNLQGRYILFNALYTETSYVLVL
ncbi:hypothetical protein P029_02855 [Anaplasma phagocytophilum str. Norway variant2]|uniref:Uncharacterized protein n=1 Tax=Anaplasma phagocytophilum str. Norway variant2 TaxID=1392507 RepID=A0A161HWS9_ANAPH|nr:hypothetical protein [Anaplasma phagocytophilum]ANC34300.1 hypothetical protein P029_02855 [Anaplasma phagocytophilum str. Norway variant2]